MDRQQRFKVLRDLLPRHLQTAQSKSGSQQRMKIWAQSCDIREAAIEASPALEKVSKADLLAGIDRWYLKELEAFQIAESLKFQQADLFNVTQNPDNETAWREQRIKSPPPPATPCTDKPVLPDPHELARQIAVTPKPVELCLYSERVGVVKSRSWQSTFTVLGFPTLEAAREFLQYLCDRGRRRVHSLMLESKYLDCPREVGVWGLPDAVLDHLVKADECDRQAQQVQAMQPNLVTGESDPVLTECDREQLLYKLGFTVMDDVEPEPPDETYRHWEISIDIPNGGILSVTIESPDGIRYARPTFQDYDEQDWDGVMALGKQAVDLAVDGRLSTLPGAMASTP